MRIIFMGSPEFAVTILQGLLKTGHEVIAVFSSPLTARSKRGNKQEHCPVANFALNNNLNLLTPSSLKSQEVKDQIKALNADVIIVAAYGFILPKSVLNAAKYGCINIHASILPRWRGAAPIERAIEAGDEFTGISIMQMEAGLDTGPVALEQKIPINKANSGELRKILADIGSDLLNSALELLQDGKLVFMPQKGEVTYAHKIEKSETRIDWSLPAEIIERKIRALSPQFGAWCEMNLNEVTYRVKIFSAEIAENGGILSKKCGDGKYLNITLCQKAGGKILSAKEFCAGYNNIEIF